MLIGGTILSSVEFHGNMSLVIFLAKCPLRCPYCHNSEILEQGTEITLNELFKKIDDSTDFIDAVVVSGGEPLVQSNDLIAILKYAKSKGLKTKLDTSGLYPKKIDELLKLNIIDYIALDIKAPFKRYKEVIGANIGEDVKKSMELINKYSNITLECRTTYVPTLLNSKDIHNIAKEIDCDIYTLQQFRNRNVLDKSLEKVESPNAIELKKLASSIKPFLNKVNVKSSEFGEESITN